MMKLVRGSTRRLAAVASFLVACALVAMYLLWEAGAQPFGLSDIGYESAIKIDDIDNLANASDVRMAGVVVGRIKEVQQEGKGAHVIFTLDRNAAPLHDGATARVGSKSLVEASALELTDGSGAPLPSGTTLSRQAVQPNVQLRDVLASLDPPTRDALGRFSRALGPATAQSNEQIAQTMTGLGSLGREGHTALDALAAQSEDLTALARETNTLMEAFDSGEGQIASLVQNSQELTSATAGQRTDIEATMQRLPGVLGKTETATQKLTQLSGSLAPVAADLKQAAPPLDSALLQLSPTIKDVRALLPSLDGTLQKAPKTLDRVPRFGSEARGLIPEARNSMRDLNPMLAYLRPYGHDLAAFFTNYGSILQYTDEAGLNYLKILPTLSPQTVKNNPLPTRLLTGSNAYPKPGQSANPGPFTGPYPRVERAPR